MGRSKNSGLGYGIGLGNQVSLFQSALINKIDELSNKTKEDPFYDKISYQNNVLYLYEALKEKGKNVSFTNDIHKRHPFSKPKYSPIHIPKNANMKVEIKNDYEQVKYTWKHGNYFYEARWHTKTKDAPVNGQS